MTNQKQESHEASWKCTAAVQASSNGRMNQARDDSSGEAACTQGGPRENCEGLAPTRKGAREGRSLKTMLLGREGLFPFPRKERACDFHPSWVNLIPLPPVELES